MFTSLRPASPIYTVVLRGRKIHFDLRLGSSDGLRTLSIAGLNEADIGRQLLRLFASIASILVIYHAARVKKGYKVKLIRFKMNEF